ncbi:carbohydrate ABC transporter permease [Paenibacillus koleovorans]|uniref:carbohydrate ABC transporter permease n=1 Tax=Paenibacillus koleovorans TaxID=121608 RepID=UPI0013E2BD50|nr:sugar ABC transporter permease [Paenibacillus koleovorans]
MNMMIKRARKWMPGYLFIFPSLFCFLLFLAYPAVEAIRISFYRLTMKQNTFIGLDNFIQLYHDPNFVKAFWNTMRYVVYIVPFCVVFSIFVAVLIYNKGHKVTSFYRAVFYIPVVSSVVAVSLVWNWIYNPVIGVANYFMNVLGFHSVNWLSDANGAFLCVVFVIITWSVGQPIILYTAALGNISTEYYEAASIDGAGVLKKFMNITWPLVKPTTLYVVVISTIHAFQTFAVIHLLTQGGPYGSTTSIIYELYLNAFLYTNFGYASAMGVVLFLIIGVISYFQFRIMTSKIEF